MMGYATIFCPIRSENNEAGVGIIFVDPD